MGPRLAKKVCSVGLRSYLEVVSVAKSIKRVVLLARKSLMNQPICFYYVSLRIRILGQVTSSREDTQGPYEALEEVIH